MGNPVVAGTRRVAADPTIRLDLGTVVDNAAWIGPAVVACALLAGFVLAHLPGTEGDTVKLVHGAHAIDWCVAHGFYPNCGIHAFFAGNEMGVGPFALFQYVPTLVLVKLVMTDHAIYDSLTIISLISFWAVLAISVRTATRTEQRGAPAFLAVILLTSPLVYYSTRTFGESLGSLLFVVLAVAALRRWPPAPLALCALLATITKETVFPVVALLGAVSLWATPIGRGPLRRAHWFALASGVLLGIAVSAGFNWFRFGQLTNSDYLQSNLQVPGLARKLDLSVGLWVAPNGGVAMFWPLATAVVIGVLWIAIRPLWQRSTDWRRSLPAIALVASLLVVTGTLASWYAPFGWIAWGPRLMLLTLPAVVLSAFVIYAPAFGRVVRWLFAAPGRIAFSIVAVIAVGLPQISVLHAPSLVWKLFSPDATCPTLPFISNQTYYYRCIDHYAWGRHWIPLDAVRAVGHSGRVLFAVAFAAVWAALLLSIAPRRLRLAAFQGAKSREP